MGQLAEARKKLENLKFLKEAGYKITDVAIQLVQQEVWAAEGIRQIWKCRYCPDFYLELFVRATGTTCKKDHECFLHWESPRSVSQETSVDQDLDLPKSLPDSVQQENTPLLPQDDSPYKLSLPGSLSLSLQRKTEG